MKTMPAIDTKYLEALERQRAELIMRLDHFEVGGRDAKLTDAQVQAASHYARRLLAELNRQISEAKRRVRPSRVGIHLF